MVCGGEGVLVSYVRLEGGGGEGRREVWYVMPYDLPH